MVAAICGPAAAAQATSTPELLSSTPERGARITLPPSAIRLEFSAWPIPGSSISVTGPRGRDVGLGPTLVLGTNAIQYLEDDLPIGTYVVAYRAKFGLLQHTFAAGKVMFTVRPTRSPTLSGAPAPSRTEGTSRSAKPYGTRTPKGSASTPPSRNRASSSGSGSRAQGADLVALGAPVASDGTASGGLPLPPTLVLTALVLATMGFAADRWWGTHRDRAQLRNATASPAAPAAADAGQRAGSSPTP